jgi:hypothetical protein
MRRAVDWAYLFTVAMFLLALTMAAFWPWPWWPVAVWCAICVSIASYAYWHMGGWRHG